MVDGVSKATNAESIYVQNKDRMTVKVAQLAQTSLLRPSIFLTKLKLPQLEKTKIEIDGLGHNSKNPVALFQSQWLFYRMKNITPKTFSKLNGKPLEVEMEIEIGTTKYSELKIMKLSETTNHGKIKMKILKKN